MTVVGQPVTVTMFVQRRTGLAATGIVYYGPITEASISYDRLADTDCYNTGGVLHPEKRLVDLDAERVCFQYRHYFSYLTHQTPFALPFSRAFELLYRRPKWGHISAH